MTRWPHVVGDGEFNLCFGHSIKSQPAHAELTHRLRAILLDSGRCAVGIPNLMADTKPFWDRYRSDRYARLLDQQRVYLSAFISRPDSAPWIHTPAYWRMVEDLWRDKDVTLVRGSDKSLTPALLSSAKNVREVRCERQDAWRNYARLLDRIGTPTRVLLCCGPTATVLAVDLCARGVHAVDVGHVGLWMQRLHLSPAAALQEGRRES
jgi:hypothetical protein